jgi:hypothetical protein
LEDKKEKLVPLANLEVDYEPTGQPIASQRSFSFVTTKTLYIVVQRFIFQIDWIYD